MPDQQKQLKMIGEAFQNFDMEPGLNEQVRMKTWVIDPDEWHGFVDSLANTIKDEWDKKHMATWKKSKNKRTQVDLSHDYDEKSNTFELSVRAYKKQDDGKYKAMEGILKSVYKVRQRHVKRGWMAVFTDMLREDIAGYETVQEQQKEREEQLAAALADGTVLNTYIGENFAHFLIGVGIECVAVSTLKQLEEDQRHN